MFQDHALEQHFTEAHENLRQGILAETMNGSVTEFVAIPSVISSQQETALLPRNS